MKVRISNSKLVSVLLAKLLLLTSSNLLAQASEEACSEAQTSVVSAMEKFREAYFMRAGSSDTAEQVMNEDVMPATSKIEEVCPENIAAAIRGGVERANLSLADPRRWELVACDKALVEYKSLIHKYDHTNLGGYSAYRNLLYSEIDPSAKAAVEACPQMAELAQQTRGEIMERQARLDKMEDIDNQGPSYWDTRDNMEEYNDAYEEATN